MISTSPFSECSADISPTKATAESPSKSGAFEQWYVACTQRELPKGRPLGVKILGLGVALFRSHNGEVTALIDQCVHRGTRLSAGKLVDDCLVCPYHGWRYDAQGCVVHIPTIDGTQTRNSSTDYPFRQRKLPVRELDGLVWIYLGTDDPSAKQPFRMPFYQEKPWQSYYMVNTFDGDVGMLAQNFMDVPHTVFVHSGIFRSSQGRAMEATVALKPASIEVTYHDSQDKIGMMDWLTNPHGEPLVHTDRFFIPNVTRCDYLWGSRSGFLIVSQITPIDARQSRVYTYIAYRFSLPGWVLRILRPFLHLYTHIVIQQDVRIMRAHRQGLDNAPGFAPHNVRADIVHVGIDRLLECVSRGELLPDALCGEKLMRFEL